MKKIVLSFLLFLGCFGAYAQLPTMIVSNEIDCNVDYSLFATSCLLDETVLTTIPGGSMAVHNYYSYTSGTPITPTWMSGTPPATPILWTAIKFGFYNGCFAGNTIGRTSCGYTTSWNSSGICLCQGQIVYVDWIPLPVPPFAANSIYVRIHY